MWVSELSLRDFRNHESTAITLQPGVTVFIGSNGQGKTNLVEALGYLANLSSHRVSADKALVRNGCDDAFVLADVHHESRTVNLALQIKASGSNRAKKNGQNIGVGELVGWLKVVLFTPEDLSIIRGDPGTRRRYLDDATVVLRPQLHPVFSEYDRVIRQRNALLRSSRSLSTAQVIDTLTGWDIPLAKLAATITHHRLQVIYELQPEFASTYEVIAPDNSVSLGLDSPVSHEVSTIDELTDQYASFIESRRREEIDRGMTLVGPHRDDLDIVLNDLPGRTHSSHGEAWSLALSLKMALAQVYRRDSLSGDPVMILDDVFAELDAKRRATLQELVRGFEQVLVTAAVREDIPDDFVEHVFSVEKGVVISDATPPRSTE
jgi:DNA replication and repair protein RecF